MIGAFSPPIAVEGRPEDRLVVVLDIRDDRHTEVEDVRRVEPAAEPDLDDGEVDPLARELGDGRCREGLELGRWPTPIGRDTVDDREHPLDGRRERVLASGFPSIAIRSR